MGNELADKLADEGAREETPCTVKPWRPEDGGFCEFRRTYPTRFTADRDDVDFLFGNITRIEAAENASMDVGVGTRGRTRKFVDLAEKEDTEEVKGGGQALFRRSTTCTGAIAESAIRCGKQKRQIQFEVAEGSPCADGP